MEQRQYTNCISHSPQALDTFFVETEEEIVSHLLSAQEEGRSLYIHSTGNNWGYGAKAPSKNNSYVLSLKKMNQIRAFNPRLGTVEVEGGVTYQMLHEFLKENGDEWLCPVHGGGPDCSVMGNVLERGFGITPIEDHFSSLMSLRAILPNGEIYESSFTSLGQSKLCKNFQWGIGPYMDGLFTQSNFGIVSRITIKLGRKTEARAMGLIKISNNVKLEAVLDCVYQLQVKFGANLSGVNLMNKERMASMTMKYPDRERMLGLPVADEDINATSKALDFDEWTVVFSINGTDKIISAIKSDILKIFKPVAARAKIVNETQLPILKFISKIFPRIGKLDLKTIYQNLKNVFEILNGKPNHTALKLAYWMNADGFPKEKKPEPDKDNCGLIWYAPIIPMEASTLQKFYDNTRKLAKEHGFNPLVTFTSFNHLALECTFPILYNKDVPGAAEKAQEFFKILFEENQKIGCIPYRLPIFAMDCIEGEQPTGSFLLASKLKQFIDPNNTIAPGRYVFSPDSRRG